MIKFVEIETKKEVQLSKNTIVYDFEVDEDHSYTTNDYIVHNCTTSIATGIGVGQASLIRDIANWRDSINCVTPLLIADGGIKVPGDLVKAIALGADVVMAGFVFAGAEESPGDVIKFQDKKYKQYAGEASFSVKKTNKYVEGEESLVPYSGPVANTWSKFEDGLRSAMSYMNAKTVYELRYQPDENFVILSGPARGERNPYV